MDASATTPAPVPDSSSIGAAFVVGALAASVAAVPAALRASSFAPVWLTLAGSAAFVLGPVIASASRVRPMSSASFAVLTGLGLAALPIAILAATLKEATHHRPLGGVTFAVAAVVVTIGAVAFALRVVTWRGPSARMRARVRAGLLLGALAGPALLCGSALSASSARASALDVAVAFGCIALVIRVPWPTSLKQLAARAGLPAWVALVGSGALVGFSGAGAAAFEVSPALFAPFAWFAH